jgi:hypothetical protein
MEHYIDICCRTLVKHNIKEHNKMELISMIEKLDFLRNWISHLFHKLSLLLCIRHLCFLHYSCILCSMSDLQLIYRSNQHCIKKVCIQCFVDNCYMDNCYSILSMDINCKHILDKYFLEQCIKQLVKQMQVCNHIQFRLI